MLQDDVRTSEMRKKVIHRNSRYIKITNFEIIRLRLKIKICIHALQEIKTKLQQLGRVPETIKRDLAYEEKSSQDVLQ